MSDWLRVPSRRRATAWEEHRTRSAPPTEPSFDEGLRPATLYRLVMGVDPEPSVMPEPEVRALQDQFATDLLQKGDFPLTVQDLLSRLDAAGTAPHQKSYMISEAGQIPPDQPLKRDLRFAVVRGRTDAQADVLVSTGAVGDPETVFLQVAAWDNANGLFNYYMRMGPTWVWSGDSYSALSPGSRGNGCFDSHVNGSVVMKELKAPWMSWQSMKATILLADDDPLRQNPLWQDLRGAEDLEILIRGSVRRWTAARFERAVSGGRVEHVDWLLRQLCTTTTVNLTSSDVESRAAATTPSKTLPLPLSFWLDADALVDTLAIPVTFDRPVAAGQHYADSLTAYGFALVEDGFRQPGDTYFAFVVPEPSLEDNSVIEQLVTAGLLTAHFAASVLMIDFMNPVFSTARAKLLAYVPATATVDPARGGLSGQIADAILAAVPSSSEGSPERQFAANWALTDSEWPQAFATRLDRYMGLVNSRVVTAEGFDDYVRLAESRRREFKALRLNEFRLTLPATNIPDDAPLLQMNEDGTISEKT